MKREYWLYIEPFVNIFRNNETILVYNTLNGKYLEYPRVNEFESLFRQILMPSNNYVVSISEKDFENERVIKIIHDLRYVFAGDILKKEWSKAKPIQIFPILNLQNDVEFFKKKDPYWIGEEIMKNILNLTFYINNFSFNYNSKWNYAYKQTLIPFFEKKKNEISLSTIKKILQETQGNSLNYNIIGGNILLHSEIYEIISLFNEKDLSIGYYLDFIDFIDNINQINFLNKENSSITISVFSNDLNKRKLNGFWNINYNNIFFKFIIEKENDLKITESFINEIAINNYTIFPLYNNNIDFFKRNVFLTKKGLFENIHSQLEIFQNQKINKNFFGYLAIMPDGSVYSNINEKKIGSIHKMSLKELAYKEMYLGRSWRKVRKNVKPCNKCTYKNICPPISNFEFVLKRFNLCDIK